MAKVSAHGTELARIERPATSALGGVRYRAMSDGVVLRQLYIDGRWEPATIARTCQTALAATKHLRFLVDAGYGFADAKAAR